MTLNLASPLFSDLLFALDLVLLDCGLWTDLVVTVLCITGH